MIAAMIPSEPRSFSPTRIAIQDRHLGGVQAGKALANGKHIDELFVFDPMLLAHQARAEVTHHAAEAGGSDYQRLEKYLPYRDSRRRFAGRRL